MLLTMTPTVAATAAAEGGQSTGRYRLSISSRRHSRGAGRNLRRQTTQPAPTASTAATTGTKPMSRTSKLRKCSLRICLWRLVIVRLYDDGTEQTKFSDDRHTTT